MDPIGLAVGVGGLAFQFCHVAKKGYKAVSRAKLTAKDSDILKTMFQVEHVRFREWATVVGLTKETPHAFEQRFATDPMRYGVLVDCLIVICNIFAELTTLEKKYGLVILPPKKDKEKQLEASLPMELGSLHPTMWMLGAREERENELLKLQQTIPAFKKLQWSIGDKSKFESLHKQLKHLNDGLYAILPRDIQNLLCRSLIISQPGELELLDKLTQAKAVDEDYTAAASVKTILLSQLRNGRANDVDSSSTMQGLYLNAEDVSASGDSKGRCLGDYSHKSSTTKILIEYKEVDISPSNESRLKKRLENLASMLHAKPKPSHYRVLDCEGFYEVPDTASRRYAFVFRLPESLRRSANPRFYTLASILRSRSDSKSPRDYLLGERFRLAHMVANSVLHINSAGWLHHNIESENVLCFSNEHPSISSPYLGGFSFARIDDPREVSEINDNTSSNLYRHPDYQLPSTRSKYRRSYELYSLGVVLIEIGLWKRIDAFWRDTFDAQSFAIHLKEKVVPILGHYMGESYRDVTGLCLSNDFGVGDDETQRLSQAFSRKVVQVLENCNA